MSRFGSRLFALFCCLVAWQAWQQLQTSKQLLRAQEQVNELSERVASLEEWRRDQRAATLAREIECLEVR